MGSIHTATPKGTSLCMQKREDPPVFRIAHLIPNPRNPMLCKKQWARHCPKSAPSRWVIFPHIIHSSLSPSDSAYQRHLHQAAVFAGLTAESVYTLQREASFPQNSPFSWGIWTPTWFLDALEYTTQTSSRSVQSCLFRPHGRVSLYFTVGRLFSLKFPFPRGSPQPKRHLDRFSRFYSAPQCSQCSHCKRCNSYSNSVRPSVCLSVTHRYCVKTTARSTVQFALSDSKMCLVL